MLHGNPNTEAVGGSGCKAADAGGPAPPRSHLQPHLPPHLPRLRPFLHAQNTVRPDPAPGADGVCSHGRCQGDGDVAGCRVRNVQAVAGCQETPVRRAARAGSTSRRRAPGRAVPASPYAEPPSRIPNGCGFPGSSRRAPGPSLMLSVLAWVWNSSSASGYPQSLPPSSILFIKVKCSEPRQAR